MVKVTAPALTVAGGTYHPSTAAAYLLPTAFSGLTLTYGGDSCSDHPAAGTLAGAVFIPAHHSAFYPQLADPVSFAATITDDAGGSAALRMFYGDIDDVIVRDVGGELLPELIPNSRTMADLAGWDITAGTSRATATPLAANFLLGGARVYALGPDPNGAAGVYVYFAAPAAPVTAGTRYAATAMVQSPTAQVSVELEWRDSAGAVITTTPATAHRDRAPGTGNYGALRTEPAAAPAAAVSVRVIIRCEMDPVAAYWLQEAGVDGLALHELAPGLGLQPAPQLAGRYVKFKAADALATAARLVTGTTPWPSQNLQARIDALNSLVPGYAITFGKQFTDDYYVMLGPRDIDRQNMLEIYQRIIAGAGELAIASVDGPRMVGAAAPPRYPRVIAEVNGAGQVITDPALPVLPPAAIMAGDLQAETAAMANQVRLEYRELTDAATQAGDDAAALYVDESSVATYGAMARTIATDLAEVAGTAAEARARRLALAQGRPYYRMTESLQPVPAELDGAANVAKLYSADRGFGQLVHIPGAPALLGEYQRIKAATVTFGRQPALQLDAEPADYAGPKPITFQEVYEGTFYGGTGLNLTLPKYAGITIDQLQTVSAQET